MSRVEPEPTSGLVDPPKSGPGRRRAIRVGLVGAGLLVVGLGGLAASDSGVRRVVDHTASVAAWAVAAGTLVLAAATFQLARQARDEVAAVRKESGQIAEQIQVQKDQLAAAHRPYVFPWTTEDWVRRREFWSNEKTRLSLLPLKNGGTGLALNVRGRIVWSRGSGEWTKVELSAGSIAPNDGINARIGPTMLTDDWSDGSGYVKFEDLAGASWFLVFRFVDTLGGVEAVHDPAELVTGENDPVRFDEASLAARARQIMTRLDG